jgi:hypothetical protein
MEQKIISLTGCDGLTYGIDWLGLFFLILAIAIPTWAFFQKDHLLYWKRWRDNYRCIRDNKSN